MWLNLAWDLWNIKDGSPPSITPQRLLFISLKLKIWKFQTRKYQSIEVISKKLLSSHSQDDPTDLSGLLEGIKRKRNRTTNYSENNFFKWPKRGGGQPHESNWSLLHDCHCNFLFWSTEKMHKLEDAHFPLFLWKMTFFNFFLNLFMYIKN